MYLTIKTIKWSILHKWCFMNKSIQQYHSGSDLFLWWKDEIFMKWMSNDSKIEKHLPNNTFCPHFVLLKTFYWHFCVLFIWSNFWRVAKSRQKFGQIFGEIWSFGHKIWPNRQIWPKTRQIYFGDLAKFGDLATTFGDLS